MKIKITFVALFIGLMCNIKMHAYTYNISFAGSGLSTTVDSVMVQNLTKRTTAVVLSGMSLSLTDVTTGSQSIILNLNSEISLTSSSIEGNSILSYSAAQSGTSKIYLIAMNGSIVSELSEKLEIGKNSFDISAPRGVYVIKVIGNDYIYSGKFVSKSSSTIIPKITFRNHETQKNIQQIKANNSVSMLYSNGDQLIFSGKSGNNCTLVADVPNADNTITFEFHECKDLNGKYYPVTKIGTQVWMAENLAYLPEAATADATIGSEDAGNSGKAFYYVKDMTKYGVLYNWFGAKVAVPNGWHLPLHGEWSTLSTYLGGNSVSGANLKATTGWNSPNVATNSSCFSALAGGYRDTNGYIYFGTYGQWWTATPQGPYAYYFSMNNVSGSIQTYADYSYLGCSVRCVMN